METKLDKGFLRKETSDLNHGSGMVGTHLLVNIQFTEDLGSIQEMGIVENPVQLLA